MLTGIDASRHQGAIDWAQVAAAGHAFAFIKATDGVRYQYINWFHQNLPLVRAAGLVPGAYHFLLDHHPGEAQARYFVDEVNKAGGFGGLVPVVDIEREADGTTPGITHLRAFVAEFRRLVPGRPILIYTGRWYWVGVLKNPHGADLGPLWHSEYDGLTPIDEDVANGPEGDNYGGWTSATVWQHTSIGSCPGVPGRCDLNLFYGSAADLSALAGGTPTPVPLPPDYWRDEGMFFVDVNGGAQYVGAPGYWAPVGDPIASEVLARPVAYGPPIEINGVQVEALKQVFLAGQTADDDLQVAIDTAALAAAIIAELTPANDPGALGAVVEAAVRRVLADAGQA